MEAAQRLFIALLSLVHPSLNTHLLLQAENYEKTVRENIYCGGDSCGRAIPLGAILSACFFGSDKAMPTAWIARTSLPGSVLPAEWQAL